MKDPILLSPGVFPDVAFAPNGQIVVAYRVHERRADGWIEVHWLGGAKQAIATRMEDSSFCRLLSWNGKLWLLFRAMRDGVAVACLRELFPDRIEDSDERVLGPASGNSPVCFGEGFACWQDIAAGVVNGLELATGERAVLRPETRPTGLSRVWHGGVRFIDEDRFLASPFMLNPVYAGTAVVGEGPDGGLAVRLTVSGLLHDAPRDVSGFLLPGECNTPRVAWDGAGRYVAVTWGGPGVRVLEFSEADIGPLPGIKNIPAIGRPLWLGWIWFDSTIAMTTPQNCYLLAGGDGLIKSTRDASPIAQYVAAEEAGTPDGLERAIADARRRQPGIPVLAYWPLKLQGGDYVPSADYQGLEGYKLKSDTNDAFVARLRRGVERSDAPWIVCAGYTQPEPSEQTADLAALVPIYNRIAIDYEHVRGLLVFSAGARAGGWTDHHEIHEPWRQLAAGIPSAPPIVIPTDPPDPEPDEPEPQEPPTMANQPTPHQWITEEFPKLEAQFVRSGLGVPNANMAAFLTLRRYGYFAGEDWPFSRLMADLVQQGRDNGSIPPEPP